MREQNTTTMNLFRSKMTILIAQNSIKHSPLRFVPFMLACFALAPQAHAVCQEGCDSSLFNAFLGDDALIANTTGSGNTALGWRSLFSNIDGSFNTAVGGGALNLNNAASNTAVGAAALLLNTTGPENTAVGTDALTFNDTGGENTANGSFALFHNTTGNSNTAIGRAALSANTTGNENTAVGFDALFDNTGGGSNIAVGAAALVNNTAGSNNTAVGSSALLKNTTGGGNTAIGLGAGGNVLTADNVTCIGANVSGADVSDTTRIAGVYGVNTQSGTTAPVIVSDTGQLGTIVSSERFKKDIATMDKASETVFSLRPVTFHYKSDVKGTPQFGLIAEEVAKVNPALVLPDKEGKPFTVRYEAVNAMLLNEFLKEHRKNEKQEATIARLEKQIEALTTGLQKVSAQLELTKSAPRTVLNNQ